MREKLPNKTTFSCLSEATHAMGLSNKNKWIFMALNMMLNLIKSAQVHSCDSRNSEMKMNSEGRKAAGKIEGSLVSNIEEP